MAGRRARACRQRGCRCIGWNRLDLYGIRAGGAQHSPLALIVNMHKTLRMDFRRWLSVLSACALGWMSGFFIYSAFLQPAIPVGKERVVPASAFQYARSATDSLAGEVFTRLRPAPV